MPSALGGVPLSIRIRNLLQQDRRLQPCRHLSSQLSRTRDLAGSCNGVPCRCNDLWRRGTGPPGAERPPLHPREASLDERVAGVVDTVSVREAWSTGVVHVVCVGHLVRHVVAARL